MQKICGGPWDPIAPPAWIPSRAPAPPQRPPPLQLARAGPDQARLLLEYGPDGAARQRDREEFEGDFAHLALHAD